ncbi:PPOX class probable F420-dependent enzyme [Salinibacterium sp. CAN_S4]|uniref:PPOX class F420-dependent oxidoreductase n=1 Tax=Salinibacterium sp. CAN_S4 TaxID=2787727 RepID=UPI0018F04DDD
MTDPVLALADRRFLLLTTFRKTGEAVGTPVWVVRDGDALLVSTPRDSGKLKRLRNNPRVQLVPCRRFGKVKPNQQPVEGIAEILDDASAVMRVTELLRAKLPIEYPLILRLEGSLGTELEKRVALRITAAPS